MSYRDVFYQINMAQIWGDIHTPPDEALERLVSDQVGIVAF
ncbi:MAG: hypothetical protein VYA69_15395 [Gemmatimonadota bacterium]|nr:hypothetical protein [Gemmatimonadota bacterium]